MYQLEFEFFFPLTEQNVLDLDFSESNTYAMRSSTSNIIQFNAHNNTIVLPTGAQFGSCVRPYTQLNIDMDNVPVVITSTKRPNIFALFIYKVLGFTWRKK